MNVHLLLAITTPHVLRASTCSCASAPMDSLDSHVKQKSMNALAHHVIMEPLALTLLMASPVHVHLLSLDLPATYSLTFALIKSATTVVLASAVNLDSCVYVPTDGMDHSVNLLTM